MESLRRDTNRGSSPLWKDPMGSRQVSSEEWRRKTCTSHGILRGSSEVKGQAQLEDSMKAPEPGKQSSSVEEEEEEQQQGRS